MPTKKLEEEELIIANQESNVCKNINILERY